MNMNHESGALPVALVWVGKALWGISKLAATSFAIDFAIGELLETENEVDATNGKQGSAKANAAGVDLPISKLTQTSRDLLAKQAAGFGARGQKMLTGQRGAVYASMVADTVKAIQKGEITTREFQAMASLLYKYTLKYGDCSAYDNSPLPASIIAGNKAACLAYKKKFPPTASGVPGGIPKPGDTPATIAASVTDTPTWIPWVAGAVVLGFVFYIWRD